MKNFKDVLELVQNNNEQVVLKVKSGVEDVDLILLGLNGNETMFRVTKGRNHTYSEWYKGGCIGSYDFGYSGSTLISEGWLNKTMKIRNYIKNDLRISIE